MLLLQPIAFSVGGTNADRKSPSLPFEGPEEDGEEEEGKGGVAANPVREVPAVSFFLSELEGFHPEKCLFSL